MNTYQQLALFEMRRVNMLREERKQQFLDIINQQGRVGGLSHRQVCLLAGVSKSPYTRDILIDLVHEGQVSVTEAVGTNRKIVYLFFPAR